MSEIEARDAEAGRFEMRRAELPENRAIARESPRRPLWLRPLDLLRILHMGLWSALCISPALIVRVVTGSDRLPLAMARRLWAPGLLLAGPIRVEVEGLDRIDLQRRHLFAANHQSILDIPALFRALPVGLRFVARSGLGRVPFLGHYMRAVGMILIDNRRSATAAAVEQAAAVLEEKGSLVTFPEGTRTNDGGIGRFKSGALAPAIRARVPIVPVSIEGAFDALPRDGFRVRPGCVRIRFGAPIETVELEAGSRHELAERVERTVRAMQG